MYKYIEYPSWEEIYKDISKEDLLEIIHQTKEQSALVNEVINDYIKDNYDGIEVVDSDDLRDMKRDEEMGIWKN